uniref:DUF2325 domain-containing protein n=1 Tax=Schlesneria paludicola TaxID=360056 RepID=A0A7C4QJE9_9PLAN
MTHDWQPLISAATAALEGLWQRLDQLEARMEQLIQENRALREHLLRTASPPSELSTCDFAAAENGRSSAVAAPPVEEVDDVPIVIDTSKFFRGGAAADSVGRSTGSVCRDGESGGAAGDAARHRPYFKPLPTTDDELPMIEQRCRLKAEACRWAERRRRLLQQAVDFRAEIEPKDRELIGQARQLPDCFLWMCHPSGPNPADPSQWLLVAGCYDVLADAMALIRKILDDAEDSSALFEQAVDLVAEAQSALRVAVTRLEGPPNDHDQARVFGWLKNVAAQRQIFIRRYMRLDDPADPARWSELAGRLADLQTQWEEGRRKLSCRRKLLDRIRYKLSQLRQLAPEDSIHAWHSIARDVDELVRNGMPPSNVELRDLLIEHVAELPELAVMPRGFQLTVREIDRFLASSPTREEEEAADAVDLEQLDDVAAMLAGRAVVLIGGDRRPHAAEALQRAFQLSELIWLDTRAHESTAGFEPYVARPEVAMVLLAIRWSSHSYGEVQEFCRRYDKPLVRLPGGYNPRQVAAQILQQGSQRLVSQV